MNVKTHLNDEQIFGYMYGTLSDAQREVIDKHLTQCQICRARVGSHENLYRNIEHTLKAEIDRKSPPSGMSFAQIYRQSHRGGFFQLLPKLSSAIHISATIMGLGLAFLSVWHTLIGSTINNFYQIPSPKGSFSALACFFLLFVSMDQHDRSFSIRPRYILSIAIAFMLWLGSSLVALVNIIVIRDLTIAAVIFSGGNPESAGTVAILTVLVAAMIAIGVIIGGAEYHFKHLGQPSSWKLFSWTIITQLLVIVLPYLLL